MLAKPVFILKTQYQTPYNQRHIPQKRKYSEEITGLLNNIN